MTSFVRRTLLGSVGDATMRQVASDDHGRSDATVPRVTPDDPRSAEYRELAQKLTWEITGEVIVASRIGRELRTRFSLASLSPRERQAYIAALARHVHGH